MSTTTAEIKQRLEYLRGELDAERISYDEIHELQSLAPHIDPEDVQLLEAAGVPEFPEDAEETGLGRKLPHDNARQAFDDLSIAIYYGMEMRHHLVTNPAALSAAVALLAELRKSPMLDAKIQESRT